MSNKISDLSYDLTDIIESVNSEDKNKDRVSASVLRLPVDEIQSGDQVRKDFTKIEELSLSLMAEGQQSPIIVSPANEDGIYIIQKGERRWRAAVLGEIEFIDAIVKELPENKVEKTAGELIENIQREDLTSMEIANALDVFISAGWGQNKIAERLGKNKSFVSAHLALLKIPSCAKELSDKGFVTDTETLNILRRIYNIDKEVCESLCEIATSKEFISRKDCREALNQLENPKTEAELAAEDSVEGEDRESAPIDVSEPYTQEIQEDGGQPEQSETYPDVTEPSEPSSAVEGLDPSSSSEPSKSSHSYAEEDEGDAKKQTDWVNNAATAIKSEQEQGTDNYSKAPADSTLVDEVDEHVEHVRTEQEDPETNAEEGTDIDPAEWERTSPSDLVINVVVNVREMERPGRVMLDRLSLNPLHVWIHLTDENIGHLAQVKDVTLRNIKKNPNRV